MTDGQVHFVPDSRARNGTDTNPICGAIRYRLQPTVGRVESLKQGRQVTALVFDLDFERGHTLTDLLVSLLAH
jgi:hypothetical protein